MHGAIVAMTTGPDGTLCVLDRQVPALRTYASDGTYLGDLGRGGEGPGELKQPDSGLAALDDGRVLVRDPGERAHHRVRSRRRARDRVAHPRIEFHEHAAPCRRRRARVRAALRVRRGRTEVLVRPLHARWRAGRHDPRATDPGRAAAHRGARKRRGTSRSSRSVPFWPMLSTELSKGGEFVIGDPAAYSIDVPRPGGVLRIQRAYEPVPVGPGERDNTHERVIHDMRQTETGWDWDGPAIPDAKPAFRNLIVDDDGRIWVHLYTAAEPIPAEEIEEPEPGADEAPPLRWREPTRFDVFDRNGTYLGQLEAPRRFQTVPRPAIAGDRVWAVVEDELEVPYVVRFRIVPEVARP